MVKFRVGGSVNLKINKCWPKCVTDTVCMRSTVYSCVSCGRLGDSSRGLQTGRPSTPVDKQKVPTPPKKRVPADDKQPKMSTTTTEVPQVAKEGTRFDRIYVYNYILFN